MNFANGAQTALASSLTSGATVMTVASATGFPAPPFHIVIDAELMLVTAKAGTVWTVTRGIESTLAVAHATNTTVTCTVTAGDLAGFGSFPAIANNLCKLSLSTNQNLVSGTEALVTLDTVVFDPAGMANTGAHTITAPVTGYYLVTASALCGPTLPDDWSSSAGFELDILYNTTNPAGTIVSSGKGTIVSGTAMTPGAVVADVLHLSAGDFIALAAFVGATVSGGGNPFIDVGGGTPCLLSLTQLR